MTKLGYVLLAPLSALVISACGSSTNATASGVFPAQGFTGRQLRVEISGDATDWKDGATVSFGTGVMVGTVTVASPTDVFADITIDPAAAVGPVDVTVTSGGTFTLKQAFELKAPIDIAFSGALAQGGLPLFTITNHDFDNPFDTTTDANTGAFTNTTISGPAKTQFTISSMTEYTIKGQAFIDTDAAAGTLSVSSGATSPIVSNLADNVAIAARTPIALSGTATGTLSGDGDSVLYSVTASGTPTIVHLSVAASDPNAQFGGAIFTDTTWNHAGGTHLLSDTGGSFDVVVASISGASNYTVAGAAEQLTAAAEGTDTTNGTAGGALVASALPFMQTSGSLSSAADQDWIKVTIAGNDVNKHLHIVTDVGNDPATDSTIAMVSSTNVDVLTAAGGGTIDNTECGFFSCTSLGEDVLSDPLPAGTYFVKIGAGTSWASTDMAYVTAMWLE